MKVIFSNFDTTYISKMPPTRQLTAIMFTDIQGYTAIMQRDEDIAIKIRARHRKIFNDTTNKFNGKILQYFGDGTLSTFISAIDAVKCAMEMQLAFQEDPMIPVRIGIHLGDIVITDEEIIGNGVNVASRIESLAVAGSVFVSDKVYDEIKNHSFIETQSLKTFELKNVDKPIEVYAISNKGLIIPNVKEITGKTKDTNPVSLKTVEGKQLKEGKKKYSWLLYTIIGLLVLIGGYLIYHNIFLTNNKIDNLDKSIAVLAFENMSDDPNQEYFSDGISEEILNSLVKVDGLKVAGRTSSFSFKGKDADIQTIGNKLGVSLVLEGSVRQSRNKVRITAQLIKTSDGYHVWSEQYDRELKDIFVIQEEIAAKIVSMLKLIVLKVDETDQPTDNMQAYDYFLKGKYAASLDVEGAEDALEYYHKAIELDPEFALAYAGLGGAYINYSAFGLMPMDKALLEARKAAKKSISLDSRQAAGHEVLAYINLFYDWDWDAAKSEYERALELGFNDPEFFITWYEALLFANFDQAIHDCKLIIDRDALWVEAHWQLGLIYYLNRRYNEAIESFQTALALNPDYSEAHRGIGASYRELGIYDSSLVALEKAIQLSQGQGPAVMDILALLGASGQYEQLREQLNNYLNMSKHSLVPPIIFALGHAYLGEMDEAFIWLEKTYKERFFWFLTIKVAPDWDVFREDPRFEEFLKRMNFPE